MEPLIIIPCMVCIILIILLIREKKLRKSEQQSAQIEIKKVTATASNTVRQTNEQAFHRIREAKFQSKSTISTVEEKAKNRIDSIHQEAETRIAQAESAIDAIRQEAEARIAQAEVDNKSKLDDLRQKTEQRIREERESIQAAKDALKILPEKDLLIECISALNTYAQRIDRLENQVSNLSISISAVIKRESKEKKPYIPSDSITNDDLIRIVQESARRIDRIMEITTHDAIVEGIVLSQHKFSTWSFTIDFNDDGELTGNYTILSENDTSTIPQRLAKDISKEIIYRLNSHCANHHLL